MKLTISFILGLTIGAACVGLFVSSDLDQLNRLQASALDVLCTSAAIGDYTPSAQTLANCNAR